MRFPKVAVVGVGLIGGSFALALKSARACSHVVGIGRGAANLEWARELGIVDAIGTDAADAADADLILVATPVAQYARVLAEMAPRLKPTAIVTDAGSTKRDVVAAARAALGAKIAQFVPAHPIAGAEKSGAAAADAELFRGRRVVLTPLPENSAAVVRSAEDAWRACGARLGRMSPKEHDAVFAAVSHLPHLLAYALVHEVAARGNSAQLFGYAAGGFRDFTRIASSHPEMWRDICTANRDQLLGELDRYVAKLRALRPLVEAGDGAALEKIFAEARAARERWLSGDYE
ncbi:MAG: prephenate dehydrogenase/arogenate dehydrogenase family protein [Betaproteobacteria bacterium]|nr:prephenate dehydrogenase/arogenate dehydrogenase family protein [Betaproteobacteria bacterium]